ncbi:MAG TPA: cytochrome c biogenesis protein CcdA [Vicinamibacterales bacterium]|nr:cytochrome c biogenesis protein CcdA [Vicinamibacterales bacterium]
MSQEVTLLASFVAGFLSFVSPCVLPLIPGYISFISGLTLEEMQGSGAVAAGAGGTAVQVRPASTRGQVLAASFAFVLGFTVIFVLMGASATALGRFLYNQAPILEKIAGTLLVVFGLHMMGVFRIRLLEGDKRIHANRKPAGPLGAFLVGTAFAFAWTPCIGPILGGILGLASSRESVGEGMQMLAAYSLGLGIPFLLTSVAINQFFAAAARIRRHYRKIELVSGALLIVVGLLIFFDQFTLIAKYLTPYLPTF